jgi:hypothetical protein
MDRTHSRRVLLLIACLVIPALCGCEELKFWAPRSDVVPGITPPGQRMAVLEQVRVHAAWAKPQELEPISRQLAAVFRQETDPILKAEIVRVLGVYPTAESLAVLRTAVNDSDAEVRIAACLGWGRRKGPEAAAAMSQALASDVDGDVRLAAAEALGDIGDRSGVAALGSVLEDKDPAMQYRAVASLKKCTDQDFGDDVNRWREYVQNESTGPDKAVSVGQRIGRNF